MSIPREGDWIDLTHDEQNKSPRAFTEVIIVLWGVFYWVNKNQHLDLISSQWMNSNKLRRPPEPPPPPNSLEDPRSAVIQ